MPDPSGVGEGWRQGAETVWLPTAEEMAALDRFATESGAITERALIECAGREIAHQLARRFPSGPAVALAGSGHNGADSLVALRTLASWGREVAAVRCGSGPPEPDVLRGWEIELKPPERLPRLGRDASVLLDGILGTGLRSAPRDPQASLIREVNALDRPVVAVDGPSGADLTTGDVPGACIDADLTCTLGWPKVGLLLHPVRRRAGEIVSLEIGFPPPESSPAARAITGRWVRRLLCRRPPDVHKGNAGYLLIVAGQEGMAGASVLASRAASRSGAGIVRVAGASSNRSIVQCAVPEAIFLSWDDEQELQNALEWAHAVVVGPGLGRGADRRELVERVLRQAAGRPVLVDADGLNVWEESPQALADLVPESCVLTPHPGELSRLVEAPVGEIVSAPLDWAREASARFGCTVVLKGQPTVVAGGPDPLRVSPFGGPQMAAGGTGDVLSGAVGALLATGMAPGDAATSALFLTGVVAQSVDHPVGHIAPDMWEGIPAARTAVLDLRDEGRGSVNFAAPAPRPG